MSGAYRIEVSPNNRAGCKNTECKNKGDKILKGQLRYGTFITGPQFQSWTWKHWGCVTPKQISNLKTSIEGDPKELDGYEELPEDLQKKVDRALEQGHIDDEDWGWDIEMNREGKNGYLTIEHKRRLKEEAKALEEDVAGEGSASPSKANKKKRDHVKDEPDLEGAAEDEPPAKKIRSRTKKEPKIKNEHTDGGSDEEGPTEKKTKVRIKKDSKIKNEPAELKLENEESSNKRTMAASKKARKANGGEADGDFQQDAQPIKKGRKEAKDSKAEGEISSNIKDESSDHDTLPPPKGKKARAPRKAAAAKKIKYEDTESDGSDLTSELGTPFDNVKPEHTSDFDPEASEDTPEVQKGRKKASKDVVNGKAKKVEKGSKPKAIASAPRSNRRATRQHPA